MAGLRLGLVGVGRWGRIYIRTLGQLAPDIHLARVASRNPETAALVPAGCVVSADWQDLVAAGDLDGIIVASPPETHVDIALAAVAAGLPVLVEKPLCLDSDEAGRLFAAAQDAGALVMVEHTHLFSPAFRRLKQLVPTLGGPRAVEGRAGNLIGRLSAPILWDWGAHDVALCLDLLGALPDRIDAALVDRPALPDGGHGETFRLTLGFGSIEATVTCGTLAAKTRRFTVACPDGTLVYDDLAADKLTLDGRAVPVAGDLPLTTAVREFAAKVRSGSHDLASLQLGMRVVTVLGQAAAGFGA
ncbi:MAG: Gfo/Idh/MocA family protein [Actinomycetota bacterium]